MGAVPPEKLGTILAHTTDPIDELWVWIVQQPNGIEKIASPEVGQGYYPLVSSSKELAQLRMLGLARTLERETGHTTKLVKFVRAEVVDD
jgi:hypothetical protein